MVLPTILTGRSQKRTACAKPLPTRAWLRCPLRGRRSMCPVLAEGGDPFMLPSPGDTSRPSLAMRSSSARRPCTGRRPLTEPIARRTPPPAASSLARGRRACCPRLSCTVLAGLPHHHAGRSSPIIIVVALLAGGHHHAWPVLAGSLPARCPVEVHRARGSLEDHRHGAGCSAPTITARHRARRRISWSLATTSAARVDDGPWPLTRSPSPSCCSPELAEEDDGARWMSPFIARSLSW
ncbi:hypothetical protein Dimus_038314 [Dionaea muscipula]